MSLSGCQAARDALNQSISAGSQTPLELFVVGASITFSRALENAVRLGRLASSSRGRDKTGLSP